MEERRKKAYYDVYCPKCHFHFQQSYFTREPYCPSCKYKWAVDMSGKPVVRREDGRDTA